MSKKALRELGLLIAICLIAALFLAFTNQMTVGPIQENKVQAAEKTRTALIDTAAAFAEVDLSEDSGMDSCYEALDADGNPMGYVIQTTVTGYGGDVVVTLGLDDDGVITGVNVGGENFSETPGLGALAKEEAFTGQYIGKKVPLKLVKSNEPKGDDTIDAIAGATRTSAAVNGGINLAGKYIADLSGGGSLNTASAQGFAGPVAVTLELDGDGAISSIVIGDAFFNETENYGLKALEDSFQSQFIGMKPPLELSDIDAISGATVTSTAVVKAINTVYAQLTNGEVPAKEESGVSASLYEDGAWRASAQGFGGPVAVKLVLSDLTISEIAIGDREFNETEYFGDKALESSFQKQFIGKSLPLTTDDIDGISGATITTNAVLSAIDAIYQAASDDVPDEPQPLSTPVPAETNEASASGSASDPDAATLGDDGAWRAAAQGFAGPVAVKLVLDGSTIKEIAIGDNRFNETEYYGEKALEDSFQSQFVGKSLPLSQDDIDGISGATITTNAVLSAIEKIHQAVGGEAPQSTPDPDAATLGDDGAWRAAAQGFAGPVAVKLVLDGSTIKEIAIGDNRFNETEYYGEKALEDSFQNQFVGKSLPLSQDDIDGISGATITTNAVLSAIEKISNSIAAQ